MKRSLEKVISQCEHRDAVEDCPLWLGMDGRNNIVSD